MPKMGVPSDKRQELERSAMIIADAKNHHLSEWRRLWRLALAEGTIDEKLFDQISDSIDYVGMALLIAKEQNALIMRHDKDIYGGDADINEDD